MPSHGASYPSNVYVGMQINEAPHTHKSNTVIRANAVNWQKCSLESVVFAAVWVCINAEWLHILWEYVKDLEPSGNKWALSNFAGELKTTEL